MFELNNLNEKKEIHNFKIDLINKYGQKGSLISLLQSAQDSYGCIPENVIEYISELEGTPVADIYGVITFYSQFRLKPLGKNIIRICEGTACHVNGAKTVLQELEEQLGVTVNETSEDGTFTLLSVACLGCCSLAPVMMINNETFGNLTTSKLQKTLKNFRSKTTSEIK
ncbi:MAG: NADH-quinone oxidoreductase subunit E [Ignavibacteria bacterium]|nr:MAG: NADH-quinone oxidoreductase subunit E [Ignavibacteria bacterium]KAF0159948.1 MAG: NADH-quinone oxidoreductase subunit E [Ignavibacteria bacterium]